MQQRYKRRNREEESLPHLATLSRQKALTAYSCAISLLSTMATSSAHAVVVGAGPSASHSLAELGKLRNRVTDHYGLKRLTLACIRITGVVGLSTAIKLLEAGYAVDVVARDLPGDPLSIEFTSPWAVRRPYLRKLHAGLPMKVILLSCREHIM